MGLPGAGDPPSAALRESPPLPFLTAGSHDPSLRALLGSDPPLWSSYVDTPVGRNAYTTARKRCSRGWMGLLGGRCAKGREVVALRLFARVVPPTHHETTLLTPALPLVYFVSSEVGSCAVS